MGRYNALLAASGTALGLFYIWLWYPGVMDYDSRAIAEMAKSGNYSDWFPPAFIALWALTDRIGSNPEVIFLLQISLVAGGVFLFARSLPPTWATLTIVCFAMPPAAYLFHETNKDTVMGGALTCLAGLVAYLTVRPASSRSRWIVSSAIVVLSGLALSTRHNALFGVLPLLVLGIYAIGGRTGLIRRTVITTIALLIGMSAFTRYVLQPASSPIMSALVEFDIAGVLYRSRDATSIFATAADTRNDIDRCYNAGAWDALQYDNCAAKFGRGVWETYNKNPRAALAEWAKLIILHPISYLQHRAAHMASLLRIICRVCDETGTTIAQGAEYTPAGSRRNVPIPEYEHWAQAFYKIIRPWIVLLFAASLAAASGLRLWRGNGDVYSLITFALSLSAILYTAGYAVIGISDPFRYLYWLYSATGMAAVTSLCVIRTALPNVWTVSPGSAS
jgi:hypothetical protein